MRDFARPLLRLVTDDTWFNCRNKAISRSGYGGGRHALAGLMTCACCASTLTISSKEKGRSAYCAACSIAKSTNSEERRLTSTVAVDGLQLMLKEALHYFISQPMLTAFRDSLRQLLAGDVQQELETARRRVSESRKSQERLSHMLSQLSDDDPVLEKRYDEARQKVAEAQRRVTYLEAESATRDARVVEAQLSVDPVALLDKLFDAKIPAHEVRAVLSRLFPSIVFLGRTGHYESEFRVRFAPGVAVAMASGTATLSTQELEAVFRLRYWPRHGDDTAEWTVSVLQAPSVVAPPQAGKRVVGVAQPAA